MSGGEQTRRRVVLWSLLGLGALLAAAATLIALSSTVYSASAFVQRYFDAIRNDTVVEALRTPGVSIDTAELGALGFPETTSSALLRPGLITEAPSQVTITADEVNADGSHTVSVDYQLAGTEHSVSYTVQPEPAILGIMPRWRFETSPLQLLTVHVQNGSHFDIGSLTLDSRAANGGESSISNVGYYLALAPAVYTLHYDSQLAAAEPTAAIVLPGTENSATVSVLPTQTLVDRVQSKLDDFLAECVKQTVLQPSGCPFGIAVDDRVLADPTWSIVQNPVVTLEASEEGFVMPSTPGVVHLSVPVQSLFDGEKSTLDQNVDYQVGLVVTLRDDGSISIRLR